MGLVKKVAKMLLGGFVVMLIAWLLFGAPLTPFRLVEVVVKILTGGG